MSAVFRVAIILIVLAAHPLWAQDFFPLKDVRPGLHGVGRTVFTGNRIEEFQVEILGVLENLTPGQTIVLARLSGGPLSQTGVLQGMSGSPVYIDGKLLGAVALGFPFSKEAIAGIQPIEAMLRQATFTGPSQAARTLKPGADSQIGNLANIPIPVSMSGFSSSTLGAFTPGLRHLGLQPQQGLSGTSPSTPPQNVVASTEILPGSMISVGLITGDMNMTADGTVTYVSGKRIFAFGHRFLDAGPVEMPFAHSEVIASIPMVNTSFKLSRPQQWVGAILSDRDTAVAGEIGRSPRTIPLTIEVDSATGKHAYRMQVVQDRVLTPFLTQTALFSAIDSTERTIGAAALRIQGRVEFEGNLPALLIRDVYTGDNGLSQAASANATVPLGFVVGAGFDVRIKSLSFSVTQVESKRQLRLSQAWTSAHSARPGEAITINVLLQGDNGLEISRATSYRIPIGAPAGLLNFTIGDANVQNFPDFAGLAPSALHSAERLIEAINAYRSSEGLYVRVWRQEPSFTIAGPAPGGELPDPPPSVMLILADPSSSAYSNAVSTITRGSEVMQLVMPVDGYTVSGAKVVQVEVRDN